MCVFMYFIFIPNEKKPVQFRRPAAGRSERGNAKMQNGATFSEEMIPFGIF